QYIMAETEVEGQTSRHSRNADLFQVRTVDTTSVGVWTFTKAPYLVADDARIEKIQTAGGGDLENVCFTGSERGFYISEGFKSRYRNCGARGQNTVGIYEDRCYLTDGDNFYFEGDAIEPEFTKAMYGLQATGC